MEYLFGYKAPIVETPIVEVILPEEVVERQTSPRTQATSGGVMGLSYSTWLGIGVGLVVIGGVLGLVWYAGLIPVLLVPTYLPSEALIEATGAIKGETGLTDIVVDLVLSGHHLAPMILECQETVYGEITRFAVDVPNHTVTMLANSAFSEFIVDVLYRGGECSHEYASCVAHNI